MLLRALLSAPTRAATVHAATREIPYYVNINCENYFSSLPLQHKVLLVQYNIAHFTVRR